MRIFLVIVLLLAFAETFFYPGIVERYLGIQPQIAISAYIVVKLLDRFIFKGKPSSLFFKYGFLYIGPILAVLSIIFDLSGRLFYANYSFTHFHIHPEPFILFFVYFLLAVLVNLDFGILKKHSQQSIFVAPVYLYPILLLRFYFSDLNAWLKNENGIVEMIQLVLFLASAFISYKLFAITKKQYKTTKHIVPLIYLGFTLFFAFVAMEEISWGFNLLGVTTPEWLAKHNTQNEINIHNNNNVFGGVYYAYGLLSFYCGFLWLFVNNISPLDRWLSKIQLRQFIFPWYLSSFFFLNFIYVILRFNRFHPVLFEYLHNRLFGQLDGLWEWEEYTELFMALGLFLFVFLLYRVYTKKPLKKEVYLS